jgi:hypothetical protein
MRSGLFDLCGDFRFFLLTLTVGSTDALMASIASQVSARSQRRKMPSSGALKSTVVESRPTPF